MSQVTEVKIPDIGDVDAVSVIEICVQPGDNVTKDESLLVLEGDKATMEVPSPIAGTIKEIKTTVGDNVSQGDVVFLATLEAAEEVAEPEAKPEPAVEAAPAAQEAPEPAPAPKSEPVKAEPVKRPEVATSQASPTASGEPVFASPAVRRFARELGVDLAKVSGTGRKNRIVKKDVQQFVKSAMQGGTSVSSGAVDFNLPVVDHAQFGEVEVAPLSRIQKLSSKNLARNWAMIPHVTQHDEADITELEAFRKSLKDEAARQDVKVTLLVFIMKAVSAALKAYPKFNASLTNDGESVVFKKYVHLGIAVDTPNGLVVPVIKDVDKKSIYELSREIMATSALAREGKLGMDAMRGASFTISSLGGIGGTAFTPIVNWPDVAILGLSKHAMKPEWNGDQFVPRLKLPLSLSYDHRVVDGADAARFITFLSTLLGDIRRVLL